VAAIPFTIPPSNKVAGVSTGLTSDLDSLYAAVTVLTARNVQSSAYSGGAYGDGTTDDTAAIQAAANAGIAVLPPGTYRTSSPITLGTDGTGLSGSHGRWYHGTAGGTVIQPSASFSGSAVINITANECELGNLTIDCSNLSSAAAIDGLDITGPVTGYYVHDMLIRSAPNNGIQAVYSSGAPGTGNLRRVIVDGTGHGTGINAANVVDTMFDNVYAIGCSGTGWYLNGNGGTKLIGCRSEWNNVGWQFDGNGGWRNFVMAGCNTDRNTQHGINFTCTGADPILITGLYCNRDGAGSTSSGYAGINFASGVTNPVIIDGFTVTTGKNDDGTGNATPQYGINVPASVAPALVQLSSGTVIAMTTALNGVTSANHCHYRNLSTALGFPYTGLAMVADVA
jgi:Pectate lyase superfamily protein